MITNTGKRILAKYLIGQAPAYASYIAIGCGPTPLDTGDNFADYSNKTNLDFEMFRVPIASRGFVTENGISKIVFTAELPSEERYELSEVGIYSAGSNNTAGAYDSKTLFAYSPEENWEEHLSGEEQATSIPSIYTPLNGSEDSNNIVTDLNVLQTNANNRVFNDANRVARYERCRFLNNIVAVRGNHCNIQKQTVNGISRLSVVGDENHIHQSGLVADFSKNAPTDELRFAFSVVNTIADSNEVPDAVRIIVEFSSDDGGSNLSSSQTAKLEIDVPNGTGSGQYDFSTNRYVVVKKQLQELFKTNPFAWSAINVVKIYSCVIKNGEPSENFFVCIDAMRLENVSTENALYGLTGYSVIKNTNAETIVKLQNTTNYLEFRFALDVQ